MLFSSYTFLLVFLPVVFAGYRFLVRYGRLPVAIFLLAASIFFYGYWSSLYVIVLVASIAFNFLWGLLLVRLQDDDAKRRLALIIGVGANLAALFYYKYFFPILGALHEAGLAFLPVSSVVLPLGISFFTFTQIGYLVDVSQGAAREKSPVNYGLFVTFFPHLIAGPIVHHKEMMPQFADPQTYRFRLENVAVGLSLFALGLFKKVVVADRLAPGADALFDSTHIDHFAAPAVWIGLLSYALQIYFDFSGYSDMAIGLARIFGIKFPANFNSPFKATSVIDYWQRWHMSLTRYLTLYIYNPISLWITERRLAAGKGISRKAWKTPSGFAALVALPTMTTMTLIGVWHGAGLQYLWFGVLHGLFLVINHAWRIFGKARPAATHSTLPSILREPGNVVLTHLAVLVGFVFFRSPSVGAALEVLQGLVGLNNHSAALAAQSGLAPSSSDHGSHLRSLLVAVVENLHFLLLYAVVLLAPNTQQIMARYEPVLGPSAGATAKVLQWTPNLAWSVVLGAIVLIDLASMGQSQRFLYFQF